MTTPYGRGVPTTNHLSTYRRGVPDTEPPTHDDTYLLRQRFRAVAFAALGGGVSLDELEEGLRCAVDADRRRRDEDDRPALHLVPGPG